MQRPDVRSRLSAAHADAFQSVRHALIDGAGGVWVSGNTGIGRTTFLNDLLAGMPISVVVLRADAATAEPKVLADQIKRSIQALGWRTAYVHVVLAIDDAERLRRDTLEMLDELAGSMSAQAGPLQLLLVSRPTLAARLTANRQDQLAAALTRRFVLADLTAAEAGQYLTQLDADLSPRIRQTILAQGEGRPGLIETLLHQAKERPRQTGRIAAWSLPAGLVAAGVAGAAIWFAERSPPGLPPIMQAERAAVPPPLRPSPAPALVATTGGPAISLPSRPEPAIVAALPEPAQTTPPEMAEAADEPSAAEPVTRPLRSLEPAVALAVSGLGQAASISIGPPRGLLLLAQPGDTLLTLYYRVYRGTVPPAFAEVLAANPDPIRSGSRVLFQAPPEGWSPRSPSLR